jgi:LysM repeat protein
VIAEINAYRQANGLSALQYNAILASLAQSHSEYMASTGLITHDEGGTSPRDRAYAAGYGDGYTIFISEIIYGGYNSGVSDAITWWKNSSVHNGVMLDGRYVEIGGGVATAGSTTYFTAVLGWVSEYTAPTTDNDTGSTDGTDGDDSDSSAFVYSPVQVATPMEDGSIVHIVQSGQTLWTIAAVYGVELQTLLDLNEFTSGTWVFPGDEILIQPLGGSPAAEESTQDITTTDTPPQTALGEAVSGTSTPSGSLLPTLETAPTTQVIPTPFPTLEPPPEPIVEDPTARWMILIAFVVIFGVVVGSIFFQKPAKRPPRDDI